MRSTQIIWLTITIGILPGFDKASRLMMIHLTRIKQQIPTTFINQLAINFYDHQPFFHVCADAHYDCRCSNFPYHHRWMAMAMTVAVWLLMVINISIVIDVLPSIPFPADVRFQLSNVWFNFNGRCSSSFFFFFIFI